MNLRQLFDSQPPGVESGMSIVAKAAPPVTVVSMQLMGFPIDDWIKWLTLAYVLLMVLNKLWHMGLELYRFFFLKDRNVPPGDE